MLFLQYNSFIFNRLQLIDLIILVAYEFDKRSKIKSTWKVKHRKYIGLKGRALK